MNKDEASAVAANMLNEPTCMDVAEALTVYAFCKVFRRVSRVGDYVLVVVALCVCACMCGGRYVSNHQC